MMSKVNSSVRCVGLASLVALIAGVVAGCGSSIPGPSSNSSSTTTVTLQGQVTDAVTGEAIVGAKIDIGARSAITDAYGHYELANFPANSGSGVARDYQATITLNGVTAPVNMANLSTTPRYPDRIFKMPMAAATSASASTHDFKVGKLSANIQGVVGDGNRLPIGSAIVELQDNTAGAAGAIIQTTTANASGQYTFSNIEAGVDYKLVGHTSDWALQGNVTTGKISDNQTASLQLNGASALILTNTDTYSPRIIAVSPDNNADVAPGAVNVVLTFNEPIKQDSYSIPNPASLSNVYQDINVSYGGQKAAGNLVHTLSWNATFDVLTVSIPNTGVSAKYTVDLALLSPTTSGTTTTLGKLKDRAGNGLENSPVLTSGHLLSFSTGGGVLAAPPVILSPNAASLDSNATSVMLDWQPVPGATKGYNVYRSTMSYLSTGVVEPFILVAGPITASAYTDTQAASGFNFLVTPEVGRYYVYRVTSINSDLIESAPSNEITVKDVIPPKAVGTSGTCVAPGGNSMTVATPVTTTANGQVQFTFSEQLDVIAAETLTNYTGTNISAVKLISPTAVVLDFSAPITCVNTNSVTVGTGIKDVAGNSLVAPVTLTYVP